MTNRRKSTRQGIPKRFEYSIHACSEIREEGVFAGCNQETDWK